MVCGFLIRREFGLTGGCCCLFSLLVLLLYFVDIDILWLLSVDLVCGCCRCGCLFVFGFCYCRLIVLDTVASIVFYYVGWLCCRLCEFVVMMLYCVGLAGLL